MRSLITKATLATLVLTASLGMAVAAPHHHDRQDFGPHGAGANDDPIPPSSYVTGGQLSAVLNEVHDIDARIASDRHMKLITPAEARALEAQAGALRKTATNESARGGGMIPTGEYRQIIAQLDSLDSQVSRDAARG